MKPGNYEFLGQILRSLFMPRVIICQWGVGGKTQKTPGKGQLPNAVPLNSLDGVPTMTYISYEVAALTYTLSFFCCHYVSLPSPFPSTCTTKPVTFLDWLVLRACLVSL